MLHKKPTGFRRSRLVRRIFFTLLLTFSYGIAPPPEVAAQAPPGDVANPFSSAPYTVGEKLTYNVSFANFPTAAHVEMGVANRTTIAGREAIELQAHVETLGVVGAALYTLNNDYRTFVDARTGLPLRTQITTRDGARTNDAALDYNQPAGTTAIPPSRTTRNSVAGIYDLLSAIYRARALPLAVGSSYRLQVNAGRDSTESYDVELRVTGREMTKTSVGSYNTLIVTARARNSTSDYRTRIHFTDDERHVPVFVGIQLAAGEIRAELASSTLTAPPAPVSDAQSPIAVIPPQPFPAAPPNASPSPATRPPDDRPNSNAATGATPSVGEQLNFNVFLSASTQAIGAISFDVRGRGRFFDRDGMFITATARTTGAGERLFPLNNRFASYIDPTTLLPFRTELQTQEGARRLTRVLRFDQERGTILRDDDLRGEIPSGTYDLVSLVYALRRFDLTPPRRTAVSLMTANRPHTLTITAVSREQIRLGGESIPAVQLVLTTDGREPDRNGYRLWISDDQRRLPLRFTTNTPLGSIRADLAIIPVVSQ